MDSDDHWKAAARAAPRRQDRERTFTMEPTHETHAPGSTELDNSHYESSLLVLPAPPGPEAHDTASVSAAHDTASVSAESCVTPGQRLRQRA